MPLFKQKTNYKHLVSMLLVYGFRLFRGEMQNLMTTREEYNSLSDKDREKLWLLSPSLIAANIVISSQIYFKKELTYEEIKNTVSSLYEQYLKEVMKSSGQEIKKMKATAQQLVDLMEQGDIAEITEPEKLRKLLSSSFASMYSANNSSNKNRAASDLADFFVRNDMMGSFLKEFKITFG